MIMYWAYIAGVLDADGSMGVYPQRTRTPWKWQPTMSITSTSLTALEAIQGTAGGLIRPHPPPRKPTHRQNYLLTWHSPSTQMPVLESVFGYLIIKKPQAKVLIDFLNGKIEGEEAWTTMKALKKVS
jgi:hypothetical protein